ncbi:MAG: acyltransferase [Lachnospiraceae bacterium]|nr:acyltransferase [Lachnospiraceae bacterium]
MIEQKVWLCQFTKEENQVKEQVRLALIQFESKLGSPAENRKRAEEMIRTAAKKGAELICLPELFSTGYNLDIIGRDIAQLAEPLSGPTIIRMQELAQELGIFIVAPIALQLTEGRPFNSAVLIGDQGEVIGTYSKCHLFETERLYFQPGNEFPVYETRLGKIGIMICFDAGFPEAARTLALAGAEIILCPAAWRIQDTRMWELNMPQRALENSCYVGAVNRFGQEDTLYMGGFSMACGPEGDIIEKLEREQEDILYCTLDGKRLADYRAEGGPYLPYRRPELYGEVSK